MSELLVNIDVPDLERAITFYTRTFELRLARRLGSDVAELSGGGAQVYLLETPAGSRATSSARAVRDYARHWTPVH
ncbi:MAG: VOC family protein, partial [bacterium]